MYSWKIIHGKHKRIALQSLIKFIEMHIFIFEGKIKNVDLASFRALFYSPTIAMDQLFLYITHSIKSHS